MNASCHITKVLGQFFAMLALAAMFSHEVQAATVSTINMSARLTGGANVGSYVTLACTAGKSGMTGGGALLGNNSQTKNSYSYPFTITNVSTTTGAVVFTGRFASGGQAVSITANPATGAITFSYKLSNGTVVNSTGQGVLTTK